MLKLKQKKKVNGLQAISSPKEPSQGSASGRLSNSGICVNINFVPAIKAFHKGRPIDFWVGIYVKENGHITF